jgi:hypothetical protein
MASILAGIRTLPDSAVVTLRTSAAARTDYSVFKMADFRLTPHAEVENLSARRDVVVLEERDNPSYEIYAGRPLFDATLDGVEVRLTPQRNMRDARPTLTAAASPDKPTVTDRTGRSYR